MGLPARSLRLYAPTETTSEPEAPGTIKLHLGDLLPLVASVLDGNYSWLDDFLEDEVTITEDLYEVLIAFSRYRPSA